MTRTIAITIKDKGNVVHSKSLEAKEPNYPSDYEILFDEVLTLLGRNHLSCTVKDNRIKEKIFEEEGQTEKES